jgi:hypothetical protein
MAVNVTTFSTTANQVWASSTWNVNDPSYKINTELNNWIGALADPTELVVVKNPGNATSRSSTSYVPWLIRCNKSFPSVDYGFLFGGRYAGTGSGTSATYQGGYTDRTASTSNNGYGSYSSYGTSSGNCSFTVAGTMLVAYEATGSLPWFMYAWENESRSDIVWNCLFKCDPTNQIAGSYYPSEGLEPWLYAFSGGAGTAYLHTPQSGYGAPYKGINSNNELLRGPSPAPTPYGNNYFFRFGPQYGNSHYLGVVSDDFLVSNTTTGQFGDTLTISASDYICIGNVAVVGNVWVRVS